jgi:hypothetical protein
MLKYFAILAMLVDHINAIYYNYEYVNMGYIGRFAYPIFVFLIVRNYLFYSKSIVRYSSRLFIFAIITQPIFVYAFKDPWYLGNIFFSLFFGLLFIYSLDKKDYLLSFMCIIGSIFSQYTIFGLILTWSVYYHFKNFSILSTILLFVSICLITAPTSLITAPFIFLILLYVIHISDASNALFKLYKKRKIPGFYSKYFFYLFYPVHILILGLIR